MIEDISKEKIFEFKKKGFIKIEDIVTPDEIEQMKKAYDKLIAFKVGADHRGILVDNNNVDVRLRDEGQLIISNPHEVFSVFRNSSFEKRAKKILFKIFNSSFKLFESYIIYKPAKFGISTPWHQDRAYLPENWEGNLVTFWLPLQNVTIESGCMQFISSEFNGSKILPHSNLSEDINNPRLEINPTFLDLSKVVPIPLSIGASTPSYNEHNSLYWSK